MARLVLDSSRGGTGPRASWSPSWVKSETSALHIRLFGRGGIPAGMTLSPNTKTGVFI